MNRDSKIRRLIDWCVLGVLSAAAPYAAAQSPPATQPAPAAQPAPSAQSAPAAQPRPAAEPPLGRLFYTPAQRAQLDTARNAKTRINLETETETGKSSTAVAPPPPAPEVVTYGGVVRRSDGTATVWINNQPVNEKGVRSGTTMVGKVRPDGSVTVHSQQSGRNVELRVGQRAELLTGTVEEGYSRRSLPGVKPEPKPDAKAEKAATPGADGKTAQADKEARDRQRDLEDAARALQDAAARIGTAPAPAQPAPEQAPGAIYPPAPQAPATSPPQPSQLLVR